MKVFLIFISLLMIQCSLEEDSLELQGDQSQEDKVAESVESSDEWGSDDDAIAQSVEKSVDEMLGNDASKEDSEALGSPPEVQIQTENPAAAQKAAENEKQEPSKKEEDDDDLLSGIVEETDENNEAKEQTSAQTPRVSPQVSQDFDLDSYNFSSLRAKFNQDKKAIEGLNKISLHTYSLEESLAYYRAYVRFFTIYGRGFLYSKKFNYQNNLARVINQCKEGLNTYQTALYYQEAKKIASANTGLNLQSLVSEIKHKVENYGRYYDGKKVVFSGFLDDYQKNKNGLSPVFASYASLIPYFKQADVRKKALFFKDVMNYVVDGDENVSLAFHLSFYLGMLDAIEEVYKQVHIAYKGNPSLIRNEFNSFVSCLKDLKINIMRFNREPILLKQYANLFAEYHLSDFASFQKRKVQLNYRLHKIKSTSFFNRDFPVRPEKYLVQKSFLKVHYPQYAHLLEEKSSAVKSFINKVKSYFTKKEE